MKKLIPFLVLMILSIQLKAQIGISSATYAKPGVMNNTLSKGLEINFDHFGPHTTTDPLSLKRTFSHMTLKLKIPVILRDNLNVILGLFFSNSKTYDPPLTCQTYLGTL